MWGDRALDSKFKDQALVETTDGTVEIVFASNLLTDAEVMPLPLSATSQVEMSWKFEPHLVRAALKVALS